MGTMGIEMWMLEHPVSSTKLIFTYVYFLVGAVGLWWATKKLEERGGK